MFENCLYSNIVYFKRKLERDKQKKDHVSHTIVVEDVEIPSTSRNIVTDKEDIKNELNLSDNKEFDTPEQAISSDMKVNDTNEIDDALIAAELDAV